MDNLKAIKIFIPNLIELLINSTELVLDSYSQENFKFRIVQGNQLKMLTERQLILSNPMFHLYITIDLQFQQIQLIQLI